MVIEAHDEVVYLSGSLNTNQWPAIETMAYMVYARYPEGIVINCSGLKRISPSGETTFMEAICHIAREELPFVLAYLPSELQTQLDATTPGYFYRRLACEAQTRRLYAAISSTAWWERLWGAA